MNPRRVLFLSQDLPWPPQSGGVIRTYQLLAGLVQRFRVTAISSGAGSEAAEAGQAALEQLGCTVELVPDVKRRGKLGVARSAAISLVSGQSMVLRHNHNPHLEQRVREHLRDADGVQLNQLDTLGYVRRPRGEGPAVVLDTQNVLHQYYERRASFETGLLARSACRREARLLREYELAAFRDVTRTVVCSQDERASLLALDPDLRVAVVPNGVDLELTRSRAQVELSGAGYDIVFVGDMGYGPNVDGALLFATEVLPAVRAREPRARFVVVGKRPPRSLLELAERDPALLVTGFVEDVHEPVRRARVVVVPLRYGSGTRLKVLEAFGLERPVVATRVGAEGIEARDGEHLLLADTPGELARAVLRIFEEPQLATRLAGAARELVEERYAWPALAGALADVMAAAMEEQPRR